MIKKNKELKEIAEIIKLNNKIVLLPHLRADGDSLGSMIALDLALKQLKKKPQVVLGEDIPEKYDYFKKISNLSKTEKLSEAELYIVLDASSTFRIPFEKELFEKRNSGKTVIIIDHHKNGEPEKIGQFYYIDEESSSNSEIIYELLKELKIEITRDIATCLLTGLESDTASFQNQNTNSQSFKIAADLVSKGARITTIIKNAFLDTPIKSLKLRGLVFERLALNKKYKIAFTYLKREDFINFGFDKEMTSGISNMLDVIEDVNIIFFITEEENGVLKVSMRSRKENIDLSSFAKIFNGGGHKGASGFSVKGEIVEQNQRISIANNLILK